MANERLTGPIDDYRTLLQQELVRRMARNKSYSLRAFARDLEVSAGFLSALMNRRKGLSSVRAGQILERLGWPERRERIFRLLVRLETNELDSEESRLRAEIEALSSAEAADVVVENLDFEYFRAIADWHHAAILELLSLESAEPNVTWLAARLSLHESVVADALARLCRIGLLRREGSAWSRSTPHVVVPSVPSESTRAFHRAYLNFAVDAVDHQSPAERVLQTSLMPIAARSLDRLTRRLETFTTEMVELTANDPKEQLYCLSLAFFRVDRPADAQS